MYPNRLQQLGLLRLQLPPRHDLADARARATDELSGELPAPRGEREHDVGARAAFCRPRLNGLCDETAKSADPRPDVGTLTGRLVATFGPHADAFRGSGFGGSV